MINNLEIFEESLQSSESYIDKYYQKKEKLIISKDKSNLNDLMKANNTLLENISAYKIALQSKNLKMQETIINNIIDVLEVEGMNYNEFISYWATKDVSFSYYNNILNTKDNKAKFIKNILPEYIKHRHDIYNLYGYSFSTLQVVSDSKSHKASGNLGIEKVSDILEKFGFIHFQNSNMNDLKKSDKIYLYPDKKDKNLFFDILKEFKINLSWAKNHENKLPDFLFKIGKKLFIIEHKHLKESGGGQYKQMSEIINLISYKDKDVSYIAFLDGVYFNVLANPKITKGKVFEQRKAIYNYLKTNPQNYFVNTYGFIRLLTNLV